MGGASVPGCLFSRSRRRGPLLLASLSYTHTHTHTHTNTHTNTHTHIHTHTHTHNTHTHTHTHTHTQMHTSWDLSYNQRKAYCIRELALSLTNLRVLSSHQSAILGGRGKIAAQQGQSRGKTGLVH